MKPGGACEQGGGPQKGPPLFCTWRDGAVFRVGRWNLSSSAGVRGGMPAAEEEKVDGDGGAGCVRRFFVPGGAERFSASAGVSACPFLKVRRRSPSMGGWQQGGLLVETAGQAVPVVFLCPGGGGRAPLALRLRGGTGPEAFAPPLPPSGRGGAAPGRSRAGGNRIMARE